MTVPAGLETGVTAVIGWYPVTDIRSHRPRSEDDPFTWLLGAPPPDVPDLAARASAVANVRPDAPAFLPVHGDSDGRVPYQHSEDLHRRLVDEGNSSTLRLVTGAGDCFEGWKDVDGLVDEAVAFLVEQWLR